MYNKFASTINNILSTEKASLSNSYVKNTLSSTRNYSMHPKNPWTVCQCGKFCMFTNKGLKTLS
jgi:hypothetical protein